MDTLTKDNARRVIETALALLFLLILLFDLYVVLSVFFGVFTYAIIFSVALAGLFERLVKLFKNKRGLAAFVYAVLLILIIAMPFIYIISVLSDYVTQVMLWISSAKVNGVPDLPAWIATLPFVGDKISGFWSDMQTDPTHTVVLYEPQITAAMKTLVSGGAGIVGAALEFIVGIIVSALLLTKREQVLKPLYDTMRAIVGITDGPALVDATGRAVKGVAVGVMGTAFIAALAAWIGFAIAGISFAVALAAITFFLVVIQVGPVLVWVPVAIWLGTHGQTGTAIFVTIYGIVVLMGIDNVLKPVLIARSGKLPILVLFLGVIGGMVAWGFTGMFKGAIILSVFYTIFVSWSNRQKTEVSTQVV